MTVPSINCDSAERKKGRRGCVLPYSIELRDVCTFGFLVCSRVNLSERSSRSDIMARRPAARSRPSSGGRDGAHGSERETTEAVVGSVVQAASQRRRAQKGVAAAARRGQAAVAMHAAKAGKVDPAVQKEVARAMQRGTALVAASLERLETAESATVIRDTGANRPVAPCSTSRSSVASVAPGQLHY